MKKKKIPTINKEICSFIHSEEGKISKKSIIDLGFGLIALSIILGIASPPQKTDAISSHVSHANHSSHSNHSNHSNHNSFSCY